MKQKPIRTSCRGCHGVCQVLVHLNDDGTVQRITGDKESPTSKGYICPKGASAAELVYHPKRLTRPLYRVGRRGEGKWASIGWDEATDMIARRFDDIRKQMGPEYIAIAQGTGRPYTEFTNRLCHALGSPNMVSPAFNCFVPRNICADITLGWFPQPDIYGRGGVMPRCFMVLGSNTMETGAADGYCGGMMSKAFREADTTIVIDPRSTRAAKKADLHLALRPGTECALLLGMLHVIIREKAYDEVFIRDYCVGFEELSAHIKRHSPEWAAKITRVPAKDIETAALAFATVKPACLHWGNGIDENVTAFQTARAVFILLAICGTLDIPGGMVRWVPPAGIRPKSTMVDQGVAGGQFLSATQRAKVLSGFPFCPGAHPPAFWNACVTGIPYRPRAIWMVGTNPIMTQTRGDMTAKALKEHLDFVVTSDFFITPTAALSDLVLPAAHWLEQEDIVYFHKIWCVLSRKKIIQVGETRDDRDVILEVAHKLGLKDAFPWRNRKAYMEWLLELSSLSLETFHAQDIHFGEMRYKKYETEGFKTPSGKVELFSSIMAAKNLAPLPEYTEPPVSPVSRPDLNRQFPFILMTGCKILPFFHSEGRFQPSLLRLRDKPHVDMHPKSALAYGFEQGQKVKVVTPHGEQEFYVNFDDSLQEDIVHAEHAWWFPEREGPEYGCFESNANMLFPHEHFDPNTGAECLKCYLCRIEHLGN